MAPEHPPSVVVFDTRLESGELRGLVQYIEPQTSGARLQVRWAVETKPEGFTAIGGGVAYVLAKDVAVSVVPISDDAAPDHLGDGRYRWTEGLNAGVSWVMFILILPPGLTISHPTPTPAGARVFQDRLALYWILRGDDVGRTEVTWTLEPLHADLRRELTRLHRLCAKGATPQTPNLDVERDTSTRLQRWQEWIENRRLFAGALFIGLTVIALGSFTDALKSIQDFWLPEESAESQTREPVGEQITPLEEFRQLAAESDANIRGRAEDIRFTISSNPECIAIRTRIDQLAGPRGSLQASVRRIRTDADPEMLSEARKRLERNAAVRSESLDLVIGDGIRHGCIGQ